MTDARVIGPQEARCLLVQLFKRLDAPRLQVDAAALQRNLPLLILCREVEDGHRIYEVADVADYPKFALREAQYVEAGASGEDVGSRADWGMPE